MKIYDKVNECDVEIDSWDDLTKIMTDGRQVDIIVGHEKTDADGYLTWDVEHWSAIDERRFIRTYALKGRELGESTGHNIYDLKNEFHPEDAEKVELS